MHDPVWIFGYGSLIWRADFSYLESRHAYVEGWARRFWQGSHDHRGVAHAPGRVVTLVESSGESCYGRAYLIEPDIFEHLDHREKNGYTRHNVTIHFGGTQAQGITYIGVPGNFAFLGEAPLDQIAAQIGRCEGPSGTNRDYLLQLARSLRSMEVADPHVFALEELVLSDQGESGPAAG